MIKAPKKLIEVALPLDDINEASAREKSIRHGHPSTMHLWWARRPLAAARAVLFAQLVNDPGGERGWGRYHGQTKEDAHVERERLFKIIRQLVVWENINNEAVIKAARKEIWKSWRETCRINDAKDGFDPDKLPAFHDPFAGGGAIPLEAQRLEIQSFGSDLNPIAVMINKAMIEIPPIFSGKHPVIQIENSKKKEAELFEDENKWKGPNGLAYDISNYGKLLNKISFEKIGHLYPKTKIYKKHAEIQENLKQYVGKDLTVIAWLWARTVKSPNPAYNHIEVPLVKSYVLSSKKGGEVWIEPQLAKENYKFIIRTGKYPSKATEGTKMGRGANFRCILSNTLIDSDYIKSEGKAGRMGKCLIAIVAEGEKGRIYLSPSIEDTRLTSEERPKWSPKGPVPKKLSGGTCYGYGLDQFGKLFTSRQLISLTTFSELVAEVREKVIKDAKLSGLIDDGIGLADGGKGATAYGDSISLYLSFAISKMADRSSTICSWDASRNSTRNTFARQAIPMTWDFAETNPFSNSTGNFLNSLNWVFNVVKLLPANVDGVALQADAALQDISEGKIVSTDPPYYDNIFYADLSDYFYSWMRKALKPIFPEIFSTIATPKDEELVAIPARHGSKKQADTFFMEGMSNALKKIAVQSHQGFPVTIYYAFKQDANIASTGWESFLEAVIRSGFAITGTWPMRTELSNRMVGRGANALASSIVLVCRKRGESTSIISRRKFLQELKTELPEALEAMIGGSEGASPIAPVDLAQAAIGPGMAVYSKYGAVLESDGSPMTVHEALIQINREIDDYFNASEGDLDSDSRFCIDWFQQYGFKKGAFGEADVVARAKGTSVDAVSASGVIRSGGGKVRLLNFGDYPQNWNPDKDPKIPIWEATHQLIRALRDGGEKESGLLLSRLPGKTEQIRQLAYRLYTLCERQGWAEEARAYNELISSWHRIVSESEEVGIKGEQMDLF